MKKVEYIVLIVGAGGTGGNFAKEFARYAAYFNAECISIKAVLIDGDTVEEKNEERQPFIDEDVQQPKALALGTAIQDTFGLKDFYCYPHYINKKKDLKDLFNNFSSYHNFDTGSEKVSVPILVGCVDNHRARQCMHEFFDSMATAFYFDSANEYSVGEVVLGAKINDVLIAPDRTYYYPDVLTDTSPSAEEISCGAVNVSSPQHLATNLMAANLLLSAVVSVISDNQFEGGIVYFDREKLFSRFQPYGEIAKTEVRDEKSC